MFGYITSDASCSSHYEVKFLKGRLGWIVSKQVLCRGICVSCTFYYNKGRGDKQSKVHLY